MRDEFPIFKAHPHLIYLDTAATAHKPACVIEEMTRFYANEYATVHRAIYRSSVRATEKYYEAREYVGKFLNAKGSDEIVYTRGTTEALNLVAQSYGRTHVKPGDEILISEMEHHSNIVPWQMLAKERGAILKYMPVDERGVLQWEGKITPRTKIIAVTHMSNVLGTINPIKEIAAVKQEAVLVVDGAQAAPHLKIDVQELNCDFYAFSGHKCYGPTGIGVLYGKRELLEQMPPIDGGGDMIQTVDWESSTYQKAPLRFEAGTPIIGGVIALKTALEFLEKNRHVEPNLLPFATSLLQEIEDLRIIGTAPNKGPIITFHIEGMHSLDIATMLDLKNIAIRSGNLCAQPLLRKFGLSTAARVSFGLYNTREEIEEFVSALKKNIAQLTF